MSVGLEKDAGLTRPPHVSDGSWLTWICLSRASFAVIFTAYSAVMPLLTPEWGMSASQAGLIQSAWHAGYLVSLFTIGFLADRYGAKRVFLVSSIAASASAMIFALFAGNFLSAVVLYGLTGLFSGGSYTPGLTLISERFASGKRGRAMGFYLAAASFGYALALLFTGAVTPWLGWRGAFIINACGPVAGTLFAFYALRATPNLIHPAPAEQAKVNPVPVVLKNKPAMLVTWGYAFHSWELLGSKAWLPAFFAAAAQMSGSTMTQAASLGAGLTAITYVASMAGGIAGGAISDRYGRTWTMLTMALGSMACSFALGWMVSLPLWFITAVAALYSFLAIADSSVYSTAVTELVPPRYIGAAYSVRSVLGFGAGALSPWVFGLVLDATRVADASPMWSWGMAWCSLGVGALLGPLATLRLRRMPESVQMAGGKR
jgi:MFS family permease